MTISRTDPFAQEGVDSALDGGVHADEGGPGAVESFARQFACGVEAEFAADGHLGGCVIQHVGGAAGEDGVALGIGVRAQRYVNFDRILRNLFVCSPFPRFVDPQFQTGLRC